MSILLKSAFLKEKEAQEFRICIQIFNIYSKELIRRNMRKTGAHERKNYLEPSNQ